MSREGGDCSYKPQKGAVRTERLTRRTNRSQKAARVDYTEDEFSSDTETEGTVREYGLENQEVKTELDSSENLSELDGSEKLWTPQTFAHKMTHLSQQVTRLAKFNTDQDMARETEQTHMTAIMQIMMEMRAEERKAELEREERRVEREKRRLEREQRQREEDMKREERLMTTLREAQPTVPQPSLYKTTNSLI